MDKGYGISEEIIGRWLKEPGVATRSSLRRRSTSRWDSARTTAGCLPFTFGGHARRACGGCRRTTLTCTRCTSTVPRLGRRSGRRWGAVREGKVSYVGSSNFAAWDVALAQSAALVRHFMGLVSEQSLYNLAVRTVELELIPALRSLGIGLIPYSPLNAGLLAGALQAASEGIAARAAAPCRSAPRPARSLRGPMPGVRGRPGACRARLAVQPPGRLDRDRRA